MAEPFLGEIRAVGFNFAPRGWADCNGQLLSIAQNSALFALLGTTFGGDGQTTFALPDFRSRCAIHADSNSFVLGQAAGVESVTLTSQQIPAHIHSMSASAGGGTASNPTGGSYATLVNGAKTDRVYGTPSNGNAAGNMIGTAGGSQPHNNLMPFLVVRYCIALEGIFPPHG